MHVLYWMCFWQRNRRQVDSDIVVVVHKKNPLRSFLRSPSATLHAEARAQSSQGSAHEKGFGLGARIPYTPQPHPHPPLVPGHDTDEIRNPHIGFDFMSIHRQFQNQHAIVRPQLGRP